MKNRLRYFRYRHITAVDDHTIIFEAQNGTDYTGGVRAVYEKLLDDENYRSFYFVWAFSVPEDFKHLLANHHTFLVRKDTPEYFKYYAAARYWVQSDTENHLRPAGSQCLIKAESDMKVETIVETNFSTEPHRRPVSEKLIRYTRKTLNRVRLVYLMCSYNLLGFFRSHGMFHNNNSLRLERLRDIHKGERCFLIGNGPSLTGEDLHLLKDEYTFGTNMVYKIFDKTDWRPTFHCVSDTIYASKLGSELSDMVKAPLFTTERTYRRMKKKPVDTTYVHTIQSERYRVKGNIQSYCMVKATVLSLAAEMAFHMGFREIYLLGVDCTNPHDKGGHFTDSYTTKEVAETDINRIKARMNAQTLTTAQIGSHIIDRSMEVYSLINKYAAKHGIRIYNATRGGNLELFPRVKLEDIVNNKN
ncbi:MAG: DUF115 domain-containing protein [Lachnospiraceae bacterium]|nr:DUF115 domain-containing protein [Lachnospiraceae bacterium]